jgi:hypothetical protein
MAEDMRAAYMQAKDWLLGYLADGKHHTMGECFIRGAAAGHAENMLRSAARHNRVIAIEACYGPGRRTDAQVTLWQLSPALLCGCRRVG